MDWLVRLGGDEWSLQGLSEAFPTAPQVWKDDDGHYYLSAPALSACVDDKGAWREAELTVARVNDAASALEPGYRAVAMLAVVQVHEDGSRREFAHASVGFDAVVAWARFSETVVRADGTVDPPGPSRLEQLYLALEKGAGQSDLAKALRGV